MASLPALTPTTFAEAMQFAEELAKSTMVPPAFQRNPANILVAIQWGAELGLGPLQALQNIAVVNGRPSIYGDAMLALVRGSPLCEDVIEVIKGEGDLATAVCDARRKGSEPVVRGFSVADAKKAGLWDKAIWKQYPMRMLQMRARGFALRDAFPDVLRGIISAEEAADITPHPQSTAAVADELDAFAAEDTAVADSPSPRAPESPAETEIARSQEMIAAVIGPENVAKFDEENLIFAGRAEAFNGHAAFSRWYREILDDAQRIALRPHLKGLQQAARQADKDMDER